MQNLTQIHQTSAGDIVVDNNLIADAVIVSSVQLTDDIFIVAGTGTPVDYTDGDPAATGEGVYGKGSIYIKVGAGKIYINGGTKAQPVWKLVTSA